MIAIFPFSADPNSQSMRKFSIRSRQPSLAPTNPQLTREKPQLAPIASDHSFFHASTALYPAKSTARAELPAPPPSRCGASNAYTLSRGSKSALPSSFTCCSTTE